MKRQDPKTNKTWKKRTRLINMIKPQK